MFLQPCRKFALKSVAAQALKDGREWRKAFGLDRSKTATPDFPVIFNCDKQGNDSLF